MANNNVKDTLPIVIIILRVENMSRNTLKSGITYLWDSGATAIMIKRNHILRANKVKYNTAPGPYKTTHGVKVPFSTP